MPLALYLKLRSIPRRFALYSLSITAACLPLYVVRWRVGPLPTTLLEVLIGITVLAYAATLWSERRPPHVRTPYDIPIVILLASGIVAIFVAPDHARGLGIYRAYFVEAIAMFLIAVDLLRDRRDVTTFVLVAGVGASAMAVGQLVSFSWVLIFDRSHLNLSDAPSFLNTSANSDAMYFEPPLAFALAFTVFGDRPRRRLVAGGMLLLIGGGLIFSFSRASYLALAILAVVIVLSGQNARNRLRAIAVVAVVGLVFIEIPFITERFMTFASSVFNRQLLYKEAIEMLSHMPLTGAGFSGFPVRVAPYRPKGEIIQLYPHDTWLTTWSELGLYGVIAFAVIFFGLVVRGVRALPATGDIYRPLLWGAVGAEILFFVHGLFDSPYWKNDLSVEFWLAAALNVVAVRSTLRPHPAKVVTPENA